MSGVLRSSLIDSPLVMRSGWAECHQPYLELVRVLSGTVRDVDLLVRRLEVATGERLGRVSSERVGRC